MSNGYQQGDPQHYDRTLALYNQDVLSFVQETQPEEWQKFQKLYPNNAEEIFLKRIAAQLDKTDPNAASTELRTFGTLGVLRHGIRDRNCRFSLCQFKPEHDLNLDTRFMPWATPS